MEIAGPACALLPHSHLGQTSQCVMEHREVLQQQDVLMSACKDLTQSPSQSMPLAMAGCGEDGCFRRYVNQRRWT